jgi:ketosteroid isomerase-like protein
MRRIITLAFTVALASAGLTASSIRAAGPDKDKPDEATALAVKLTEQGATTFDSFNAKAMANYYLEDGEIALVNKEEEGLKVKYYRGRAEIEQGYADVFKKPETIKSKNTVEYARLLAPDVLVIAGTFDLNTLKPDSPKLPFYQVRVKKGDQWLISSMRVFVLPQK